MVKYLFLQRSAAIFALVDRQLNNQEESQRTVSRQPVPNARALDTDHIFGQREVVTPKTPLLPTPQAVGKSCNLLTAQPSVVVTSHITHRWIGLIVYFHQHLAV